MLIKLLTHDGWRFALCVAVAVVLAGCAHETPEQRRVAATLTVAESCDAYTAASRTVRPHVEAGLLTRAQLDQIEQANTVADSVCMGPPPANVADAVARLNEAVTRLLLIAAAHDQEA